MVDQTGGVGPMYPGGPGAAERVHRPERRVGDTRLGNKGTGGKFDAVLREALAPGLKSERADGVRFSAHAESRLKERKIAFSQVQMQTLARAVEQAAGKGARESLIMMGDLALVVSIKNRTVVTAIDGSNSQGNVFTNIDSAVIT